MPDKPLPFVITDRRKFTTEGEPRPDADPSPEREPRPESVPENLAHTITPNPSESQQPLSTGSATEERNPLSSNDISHTATDSASFADGQEDEAAGIDSQDSTLPPAPTAEQMEQSKRAFDATADRLDTAIRAANPGADHPPAMSFEQIVQSVYMQAILQLGGGTPEGQQPQIDILGARQSIDMLSILSDKTEGNLSPAETTLLSSAVFELRLAFLEVTQALARSAQQRAGAAPPPPPGAPAGPRIVR